jgi:hypothetical protein
MAKQIYNEYLVNDIKGSLTSKWKFIELFVPVIPACPESV